ncbi:MAG: polymer-forming cytoskeletal protein [Steroidobacteraceae bacterium]
MTDTPRRRLRDSFSKSPTFIAAGTEIDGDIVCKGTLVLAGSVRGNGRLHANLNLSAGASWHGDIAAESAIVAGAVVGTIRCRERLEVSASARVEGDVEARSVAIANGAVIAGQVIVTGQSSALRFDEKRND